MKDTIGMELKYFFVVTCAVFLLVSNSIAEEDAPSDEHSSVAESTLVDEEGEPEPESIPKPYPRQRPGNDESPVVFPPYVYESLPRLDSSATGFVPVPDRWRQLYAGKWYDPYNQNVLKGDVPIFGHPGHEWFFEAELISETLVQRTKIALPVGLASTSKPGRVDTLGNGNLSIFIQNFITSFSLIRGNTTFKPPEYELRVTPIWNINYLEAEETGVLRIDPSRGTTRDDYHVGFLELFADIHLADISDRYDFISSRLGIQSFQSDFRGFVYTDEAPGVRLFGNYDNNKTQGNLAWFNRLEKDTNSGINTNFDSRYEDVFIGNLYRQDLLALGHQVQGSIIYRRDVAGNHSQHFDENGFQRRPAPYGDERPKNIHNWYFGLNGDGHIGRVNTTTSLNYVAGTESHNPIAGQGTDISAWMFAQELSYDIDWIRLRAQFFYASGDDDPFDDDAEGFDSINDIPNFAGGEFSFWQRNAIPLIAGGETFLVNLESLLPNFRAGKEEGQSNFVNPGLLLYGVGLDVEVTPKTKLITNISYLQFDDTSSLKAIRQDDSFGRDIGWDLSAGLLYRPFLNNNVEFVFGGAMLEPGDGIKTLYGDNTLYHFFSNLILEY